MKQKPCTFNSNNLTDGSMAYLGPKAEPFSLDDMSIYQGFDTQDHGLKQPFLIRFRKHCDSDKSAQSPYTTRSDKIAIIDYVASEPDASAWALLDLMSSMSIAANDKGAWDLIKALTPDERFILIAAFYNFWDEQEIRSIVIDDVSTALTSACEFSRDYLSDSFEYLPTNNMLIPSGRSHYSTGRVGFSSISNNAVPAKTFAKAFLKEIEKWEWSKESSLQLLAQGLPLPNWLWEKTLIDYFDVEGNRHDLDDLIEKHSWLISWDEMISHSWNKSVPISSYGFGDIYRFELIENIHCEPNKRSELLTMIASLYGKLDIRDCKVEDFSQVNIDCRKLFDEMPIKPSGTLGLDMFNGSDSPKDVIDEWVLNNRGHVSGPILACSSGHEFKSAIQPARLLGIIIGHAQIPDHEFWYNYALLNMLLTAHHDRVAHQGDTDPISYQQLRSSAKLTSGYLPPPQMGENDVKKIYSILPSELKGISAKIFLGLSLSQSELMSCTPEQRDKVLSSDLGL